MPKDRIKDLPKPTAWSRVSYRRVSRQIDLLRVLIDKIRKLTQAVKIIHQRVIESLPDPKLGQELDETTADIKRLAYDITAKLKRLEELHQDQHGNKGSAQWRMAELQIFNITREFRDIMNQYNQEYCEHREKCKKSIIREFEITGIRKTDNELEDIIEKGIQGANTFSIMIDTEEIRQQAIFIEERHRDIQKLENSIRELHAMFADLALLVSTQGEMIDNIQQSVAKAAAYVKPAVINIEDARKKKDSIRKAQHGEDSDPDAAYVAINMEDNSRFMSDFFAHIDSLRINIDKISELVEEVKRLHSTILAAPQADDRTKEELEEKMADIKRIANDVRLKLKTMETELEQEGNDNALRTADMRIRKTQHATLSRKFIDAMNSYRNAEIEYRERCKARIQRQLEITGRSVTEGEVEEMLESGNPAVFTQGIMVETAQAKQSLADIEARHGDIMKLEKSIRELHDMFIDMAALVQTQGEMIDRIEYNVVQSENFVKAASTDTKKAVKFQSAARRKLFIIIGIIAAVIVVLVIILAIVFGRK
ncbi:unnamed protein product [Rotaria sp. Silwood1]|nr:unnamed protein product [Rotaria sp. Silwood1]